MKGTKATTGLSMHAKLWKKFSLGANQEWEFFIFYNKLLIYFSKNQVKWSCLINPTISLPHPQKNKDNTNYMVDDRVG